MYKLPSVIVVLASEAWAFNCLDCDNMVAFTMRCEYEIIKYFDHVFWN